MDAGILAHAATALSLVKPGCAAPSPPLHDAYPFRHRPRGWSHTSHRPFIFSLKWRDAPFQPLGRSGVSDGTPPGVHALQVPIPHEDSSFHKHFPSNVLRIGGGSWPQGGVGPPAPMLLSGPFVPHAFSGIRRDDPAGVGKECRDRRRPLSRSRPSPARVGPDLQSCHRGQGRSRIAAPAAPPSGRLASV